MSEKAHRRELFQNQLWQGLNFAAKAGFLAVLTPWMLRVWGEEGFGMFALASSLLVSMAVIDGGVRSLTRIKLAEALVSGVERDFHRHLGRGIAAFGLVAGTVTAGAAALAAGGVWERFLHLPAGGNLLIAVTVVLVSLLMTSFLALEPLAARGRLSLLKAANTAGAVAAFPAVALCLWLRAPVLAAVCVYLACLLTPNLWLIVRHRLLGPGVRREWRELSWKDVAETFRAGGWFYSTTVAWIVKSHALTFVVSAASGPAAAGAFYVLLRITEIIGTFGSTSSDTALASLSHARTKAERAERFRSTYRYAALFCLYGAAGVGFLGPLALRLWLPQQPFPPGIGWAMAAYGLATALGRVAVNACMGTGRIRAAGLGTIAEALLVTAAGFAVVPRWGLEGLLWAAALAGGCLLPAARGLSRDLGQSFAAAWIAPLKRLLPLLAAGSAALALAAAQGGLLPAGAACAAVGACAAVELRRLHRQA